MSEIVRGVVRRMRSPVHINDAHRVGPADIHDKNALKILQLEELHAIRRQERTRPARRLASRVGFQLVFLAIGIDRTSPGLKRDFSDCQFSKRGVCSAGCRALDAQQGVGFDRERIHGSRIGTIEIDEAFISGVRRNPDSALPGRSGQGSHSTLTECQVGNDQQQKKRSEEAHVVLYSRSSRAIRLDVSHRRPPIA